MSKLLILITILTFLSCGSKDPKTPQEINFLFIGNSLTYYNDMPQMLQNMMNETNQKIKIDQFTFPGLSLNDHLTKIVESSQEII